MRSNKSLFVVVLGFMAVAGLAAPDPLELSGRYEYRTDALSLDVIGDAVCFFPDAESSARVSRPRLTHRTLWFCFAATPHARKALAIPPAPSPCGYAGAASVVVSNYKPYLGEGDGHDVADLVRVIRSEPPAELACDKVG